MSILFYWNIVTVSDAITSTKRKKYIMCHLKLNSLVLGIECTLFDWLSSMRTTSIDALTSFPSYINGRVTIPKQMPLFFAVASISIISFIYKIVVWSIDWLVTFGEQILLQNRIHLHVWSWFLMVCARAVIINALTLICALLSQSLSAWHYWSVIMKNVIIQFGSRRSQL